MKVLCVCQYGHSRSVALTRVLHGKGIPAVAVGWSTAGKEAIELLSSWADKIAILETRFSMFIPEIQQSKIVVFDVGHDRWSNPYHPELLEILDKMVTQNWGKLTQGVKDES